MAATDPARGRSDEGAAIVAVVLLMLAVTALAHGLLVLARMELAASRAGVEVLQSRLAAEAAVGKLTSGPGRSDRSRMGFLQAADSVWGVFPDSALRSDTSWAGREAAYVGRLVRLSREHWLGEATATTGTTIAQSTARLLWILDPARRGADVEAALVVGAADSLAIAGVVDASTYWAQPPVATPGECAPLLSAADSLTGSPPLASWVALAGGADLIGELSFDALLQRAPTHLGGAGTPAPDELASQCRTANPWNWGNPGLPSRPCGRHRVVVALADGTTVDGGIGQGLLLLEGDATLIDVRFYGVVVARGRVDLEGTTEVVGHIRAERGANVGPGARLEASFCWTASALSHPELLRPVATPASGWIGPG